MILVEEGKTGLDDRITRHLSGLPATWDRITVRHRHLLTHTSGVLGEAPPWSPETAGRFYPRDTLLKMITEAPLAFAPGTRYAYGNSDYYLLALLIEKASGQPYAESLSQRIFRPLGMTATRVNDPSEVVKNRASGYHWERDALTVALPLHPSQTLGSGNLLSSVADLARFDAALAAGRLVKEASLRQMWTPARLDDGEEIGYGLGWTIYDYRGHKLVGHGGNTPGFASQLSRYVDEGTSMIVLCNKTWGDDMPYKLSLRLATLVIPDLAIPARPIADTDPQVSRRLRAVIEGISAGKVDAALLSPRLARALSPEVLQVMKPLYEKEKGRLRSLSLLERRAEGADRLYMYRAAFQKETVLYYLTVTPQGRIDRLEQDPLDPLDE